MKAKKNYYSLEFSKYINDFKKTWKIINNLLSKNNLSSLPTKLKNSNGITFSNSSDIAEELNKFFIDGDGEFSNAIHDPTTHHLKNTSLIICHQNSNFRL